MTMTGSSLWRAWRRLGSPRRVAAPMVDASDLAFRTLCREHGCELAFTPMLNARLMVSEPAYSRRTFDPGGSADRPLVTQLAGHDPDHLAAAARLCSDDSDVIDLNLGCPQEIAEAGNYGAFLLENTPELALECVRALCQRTERPVSVKMRLQTTHARTIKMALKLQDAGVSALTLHGRSRLQTRRQLGIGAADWDTIRDVVAALAVPVIANGGVATSRCAASLLEHTGASAVMVGEALLENPALFSSNRRPDGSYVDQDALAARYLELCAMYPPRRGFGHVKEHCRRMLYAAWAQWPDLADELYVSADLAAIESVVRRLAARGWDQPRFHMEDEQHHGLSWYMRRRSSEDDNHDGQEPRQSRSPRKRDVEHAAWVERYLAKSAAKRHGAARKRLSRE